MFLLGAHSDCCPRSHASNQRRLISISFSVDLWTPYTPFLQKGSQCYTFSQRFRHSETPKTFSIKKIFSTKIFQNFFWKGRPGSMGINPGPKCIITNVQTSYQNILDNVSGQRHGGRGSRITNHNIYKLFFYLCW